MTLNFVKRDVQGYTVYVPTLKNNKKLNVGEELTWDKTTAASALPWKTKAEVGSSTPKKKAKASN